MTTYVEKCAGKKATHRVYYRKNGKPKVFFDAMYADTDEEAKAKFLGFAKELRWNVEVIGVKEETMTYKTEFPHYQSEIPPQFLVAPWQDASWHNDTCPSFSRSMSNGASIIVYVDEESPEMRDVWTAADGKQLPCPRFSVNLTDEDGSLPVDGDGYSFNSDSLTDVLDKVGFLVGEGR